MKTISKLVVIATDSLRQKIEFPLTEQEMAKE